MSEHQRVVEGIRQALASGPKARTLELEELARAYDAACREVNARLLRCADYLRRGLRGEAIDAARCPPDLLEAFADLDFPDAHRWEQACANLGMSRAPRLLAAIVQELGEAHLLQQPIEEKVAQHRLLALLRAPVRERIGVLRELAKADPASACWDEDLRIFEEHRLREMKQLAIAAVRARDLAAVRRLCAELDQPWRVRIDEDLSVNLKRAEAAFQQEAALAELRDLAPRLTAAYGAMSHTEARELMHRWRQVVLESGVEVSDELIAQMRPVNRWLEERTVREERERQFRQQCFRLGAMMDAQRSMEELSREHAALLAMREELPDDLEARYRRRVEEDRRHKAEEKRQHRVFLLLVLAAGLVTIVVMVLAVVKLAGK